ncbi:MAG: hypothetical protein GY697_09620 [Desulfobacterales bacterium]|nr:hypothetical protein [Desulfobacterales bacterium]
MHVRQGGKITLKAFNPAVVQLCSSQVANNTNYDFRFGYTLDSGKPDGGRDIIMAEREGFEPSVPL